MSDNNNNNNENNNDDDNNDNNNSDKRMSDAESKAAARGRTPAASKPGVVSVSGEQAARLDQRIAEKRSGAVPSTGGSSKQLSSAPAELNRLEQDLEAKQRGRSGAGATGAPGATPAAPAVPSKPGAFSSARSELTNLESDVAAKNRAARPPASTPGAVAESLDQKVAAKVRGEAGTTTKPGASSAATAELNNLENAVQAKMRTNGAASSTTMPSSSVPGARASLSRLEDAVTAKAGTVGRATAEISRLDDRIAAKNASAAAPPTSTPRSLQDAEDAVLKKKGNNDNNNVNQKHSSLGNSDNNSNINDMPIKRDELDVPEQYPVSTANKDETGGLYDGGDEGLDSDLLASGGAGGSGVGGVAGSGLNPQNDLEYGVYGGPDEKGLAVAVAVEEEDDDMFIPAAVEYDPDAKPPMYRNRRFRLYAFLAMVIVVVVTIGAAVGITLGKPEKIPDIPYRETIGIRENIERLVGTDVLDDPKSPYRKALDWVTHEDAMLLTPEDKTFTQRYYAAYFYFATTTKRPWDGGCNPPQIDSNETDMCTYLRMVGVDPAEYSDIPWTRWLTNTPECGWAGISCDELGQFRSMEFSGFNMTGTFPEGISGFPFLQSIALAYGELEGTLPDSIADMKHLVNIEVQGNAFTGTIPESWYSSRSLQRINLSINQLSGPISSGISKLKDVKGIFFFRNLLSGQLPDEIGDLNSLTYFRLSNNAFQGTIPTTLSNLRDISDLWLQKNDLTGPIPTEIGLLTTLEDLRVHANRMSGPIPDQLYRCTDLFRFDGFENGFTGTISNKVKKFVQMDAFRVDYNKLSGELPTELGLLSTLRFLHLAGNDLVGSVPAEVCALTGLDVLETDCSAPRNGVPEIACDPTCCTLCCDAEGENCYPTAPIG